MSTRDSAPSKRIVGVIIKAPVAGRIEESL